MKIHIRNGRLIDPANGIDAVRDVPPLGERLRAFVSWVARYTVAPEGMVLRMVLRAPDAYDPPAPRVAWRATGVAPERMTAARERVLAHRGQHGDVERHGRRGLARRRPGTVPGQPPGKAPQPRGLSL